MSSDIEGRFPFAITKARLGRVLRGWASVNAETDRAAGSSTVSSPRGAPTLRATVRSLNKLDDALWRDLELTARGLPDRLRPYGITPRRDATGTQRGSQLEDFAYAFSRYLSGARYYRRHLVIVFR